LLYCIKDNSIEIKDDNIVNKDNRDKFIRYGKYNKLLAYPSIKIYNRDEKWIDEMFNVITKYTNNDTSRKDIKKLISQ
jgi:hypothetical protein